MSELSPSFRRNLAEEAGPQPSRPWVVLSYDTKQFPFAALLSRDVFKVADLSQLHVHVSAARKKQGQSPRLVHAHNLSARSRLEQLPFDAPFRKLYHAFVNYRLSSWVGKSMSYSQSPKMRVHFPQTPSVSGFHHDLIVTKRVDQINFWMPFTDVDDGAALWLESTYGASDFRPIHVRYGQVLIFDGSYIGHGSKFNDTDVTRISLDMRFSFKGASCREDGVRLMERMIRVEDMQREREQPLSRGVEGEVLAGAVN